MVEETEKVIVDAHTRNECGYLIRLAGARGRDLEPKFTVIVARANV